MTTFLTTSPLSLQDASIQSDPKSSTSTLQAIYSKIVKQMEMKFAFLESHEKTATLLENTTVEIKSTHNYSNLKINYLDTKIPSSFTHSIADNSQQLPYMTL